MITSDSGGMWRRSMYKGACRGSGKTRPGVRGGARYTRGGLLAVCHAVRAPPSVEDVNWTDAPMGERRREGRAGLRNTRGPGAWPGGRVRMVRAVLVGPFSRRAWLDTMHVFTGGLVAFITFCVMAFLAAVAIVVAPTVVLVAVPFAALLACASLFTTWQRSRFQAFLGIHIPPAPEPPGGDTFTKDLIVAARWRYTWRQIGYHLAVAPVVALAWSAGLFFVARAVLNKTVGGMGPQVTLRMEKSTAVAMFAAGIAL